MKTTNMIDRTVAYAITFYGLGTSRKVDSGAVETDADRALIRVSKRILQCEEIGEIRSLDSRLKEFIARRSVAYPLKAGMHLIPIGLVEEVDKEVERIRPLRQALVERLAARVDELRERDRAALGSLFNDADYPDAEKIRDSYGLETRYLALDLPNNLGNASREVFDRERQRVAKELESAAEQVRLVQRAQLTELVGGLLDRLSPGPEGRKRILKRGGVLDKLAEFLGRYGALNVADDAELAVVVKRAQEILVGVDCEEIRSNEGMAQYVRDEMTEVRRSLEPLVQDAPRRRFRMAV
jgi:hypothetical protein